MELLQELTQYERTKVDALPLMEALEEAVQKLNLQKAGGKVKTTIKGAASFFKANPGLAVGAAAMAVSAFGEYQKNKRNTIRLHAKTAYEKRMMTSIIDALQKEGKFKIHRIKFEGGGKTWILRKKWMT